MDTSQKTESIRQLVEQVQAGSIVLPEFQRDFVWELWQTYDLFDSLIRDIFIGSLIYGVPSFELTVREVDTRPRKGPGSRKKLTLASYNKKEINEKVKTGGFRLLLDGQQRATSLCRSLLGVDDVWILFKNEEELGTKNSITLSERSLEDVLFAVAGKESSERLSIRMSDVFKMLEGKIQREKDKANILAESAHSKSLQIPDVQNSQLFERYLDYSTKLQDLLKAEKLLSYYLLDTDAEKFSLFFERSNSKGVQLNFIDILAAKLYAGFNLRKAIEKFEDENPQYALYRESIVRAISLIVSNNTDIDRNYILSSLTANHFKEHWEALCELYKTSLDYLYQNNFLLSQDWMPYEAMLIPLMMFLREIPHNDFSQIDQKQATFLRFWYWASIFSERYSIAANTAIVEDTKILVSVGKKEYHLPRGFFLRLRSQISEWEGFLEVYKKTSAIYRGVLNLVNFKSKGLLDWKNNNRLSFNSRLEDHHIFPRDYLRKIDDTADEKSTDCVLNRTLVPKITNIKIGSKKPSTYLQELRNNGNAALAASLSSHQIPAELIDGDYDDLYKLFLEDRGRAILTILQEETVVEKDLLRDLFQEADDRSLFPG